ncbi:Methionine aminopeptidase 1 [Cichlidogyrus casuarinus]|uniref:Methionine aminopeptidase n=1 Tax=Cichlidogyrus casuarinus TaxID=1844966 RepID=A0ABD2PNN6_9PLAT
MQNFNYTGPLRPAEKTPMRRVPKSIERPEYADSGIAHTEQRMRNPNEIKELNEEEIQGMERTCKFTVRSVNEIICHGIPDKRSLEEGDILNIDITTFHGGYHGDLNETIFIGRPSEEDIRLVRCAYDCLAYAIDEVKPNTPYRQFGSYISNRAKVDQFSVVRTYCGHGVHNLFHCSPNVPHYANNKAVGLVKPGHSFTIEPMINVGSWKDVTWPDKWTSATVDGKKSAQFEHTMLAVAKRPETKIEQDKMPFIRILTKRECDTSPGLAEAISKLHINDQKHFEWYGRPHFVDQLFELGFNLETTLKPIPEM